MGTYITDMIKGLIFKSPESFLCAVILYLMMLLAALKAVQVRCQKRHKDAKSGQMPSIPRKKGCS